MKLPFRLRSIWSLIIIINYVQAGPVIRSSRMVREIYPEVEQEIPENTQLQACLIGDVVYSSGSPVPGSQPCLKCLCSSGEIRCEAEACPPQPGCRAVHRQGRCCPTYQCECVHQGRIFANGERLPQPDGAECSVCYCRGGHVQCAEVGCYTRSDCEARYVKGQCCPRYDHCPPRDPLSSPSTLQNLEPELLTTWSKLENSTQISAEEGSGDEEIFLSDEPRKGSTPVTFSIKEIESKTTKRQDNKFEVKIDKSTQTDLDGRPKITIQEVIPPRTEFIPNKAVSLSPMNPVTFKTQDVSSTESNNDVESFASEKSEVYDHPPPVLRIGDQLLFIKQGQLVPEKDASTPSPVITLIGAEGLQIGLGSGELIVPVSEKEVMSTSDANFPTETTENSVVFESSTEKTEESTELVSSEFIAMNDSLTDTSSKSSITNVEDYIPEENPYYPPIPEDIMNLRDEITTDITSNVKKSYISELTVIPLKKSDENTTELVKILPEILELRRNETITNKTTEHWLKNEPTKIKIPLLNENAALPDSILLMTAPSDITTEMTDIELQTLKSDKIVAEASKESVELKEELIESGEFTTVVSNEDASVELIENDSLIDLVEIIPGFEKPTEKYHEDHLKIDENSPKNDVELINAEKVVPQEIQKRDVVKKVLKETFENPTENIRTDLIVNTTNFPEFSNEELNVVKPNEEILLRNTTHSKTVD